MLYISAIVFFFIIRCRFPRNKSIAEIIRKRYGNHVLKQTRKYEKIDYKVRKLTLDIEFLETCLANNVSPNFFKFRLASPRLRRSSTYKECQDKLLREEILLKQVNRDKLNVELLKVGNDINNVLSYFDWTHLVNLSSTCNINRINKVKCIQNLKLQELIGQNTKHNPNDVIRNYSSYELSDVEELLLIRTSLKSNN